MFLRNRTLSPKDVLKHTENDCLKLKNESSLDISYAVLFIALYHKSSGAMERFKNKRDEIFQGLRIIREKTPDNVRIVYLEKSYVNDLNDEDWIHKTF